ncbi:uncharacterized protein A1O9_01662 [Exophiala aquamarina CBS 119918]|uniref:BZIP domain-containing protein n=1 Tax=Exophiala aquamarina CBS 119918 TaxID=1182545 RepID=A0A072PUB2_9EURO|nr:uncharacterized protein A1O9_01662 [Exophiala aquamarina CBS 119918]KEF63684.1 hypothetical protein A1O9_01662 [Exophiala aquamarina CBS 119918]
MAGATENQHTQASSRYKRKLTEARREQNRRAQKLWRERQKKQRDEDLKAKVLEQLMQADSMSEEVVLEDNDGGANGGAGGGWAGEITQSTGINAPFHELPALDGPVSASRIPGPEYTDPSPETPVRLELADPYMPLPVAVYYFVPPDPDSEDMRYAWPIDEDITQKIYVKPPPHRKAGGSLANTSSLSSLSHSGTTPAYSYPPPYPLYPVTSIGTHTPQSISTNSEGTLPSPYINHLQLVGESCFSATLSIATCLGIPRTSYINDHPSPFTTSSNSAISSIPIDLRPSGFQLILAHPCYLDCIPFPHFRNMAVYLSSLKKLDHCSLFLDLMHDGLVCWGRARANGGHGRSMRDGVAWSRRSWEAKPWFWRKWGWLARTTIEDVDSGVFSQAAVDDEVDDEDGMLSGSQWWWSQQTDDEAELLLGVSSRRSAGSSSAGVGRSVGDQDQEEFGSMLSRLVSCNVGIRNMKDVVLWD